LIQEEEEVNDEAVSILTGKIHRVFSFSWCKKFYFILKLYDALNKK